MVRRGYRRVECYRRSRSILILGCRRWPGFPLVFAQFSVKAFANRIGYGSISLQCAAPVPMLAGRHRAATPPIRRHGWDADILILASFFDVKIAGWLQSLVDEVRESLTVVAGD
jgi:hypothetical protein